MPRGTVVTLGNLNIDPVVLGTVATEFHWDVDQAPSVHILREMKAHRNVVAVLFNARNLGTSWHDALEAIRTAAPAALPIVCAGFADPVRWSELADAGAFHELRLPVDDGELRRSLGFIWAAKRANWRNSALSHASNPG
jgi:DNA-binding NtrC family response regulator